MFETILLLAPDYFGPALSAELLAHNPRLRIINVTSGLELAALPRSLLVTSRLIGFTTSVIVPADLLATLGYGAYNFHPGPPSYPGTVPAQLAVYERAQFFGATVHEMVDKVDAGPIVAAELCPLSPDMTAPQAEVIAVDLLLKLFRSLSRALTEPQPLPRLPVTWSTRKSTRATLASLCELPLDISADELAKRVQSICGNHLGLELTITLHGLRFRLVADDVIPAACDPVESTETRQEAAAVERRLRTA